MSSRSQNEEVTTTHAGHGEGRPRLRLAATADDGTPVPGGGREFALAGDRTVIGSGPDAAISIDGADSVHAEIFHTEKDEYVLVLHGDGQASFYENAVLDDGEEGHVLRTGYRFTIGSLEFVYMRDEYADHGRPYGGREGGEFEDQENQPPRQGESASEGDLSYEVEQAAQESDGAE